jgi:solute carrier family 35 protein E3
MSQQTGAVLVAVLCNVVSSIAVVYVNKQYVYQQSAFTFSTTLSMIHFAACFAGLAVFAAAGVFSPKRLAVADVLSISAAFSCSIVFNNLSILHNSLFVSQIAKVAVTVLTVVIESVWHRKRESWTTLFSLVPMCLGIFMSISAEVNVSAAGVAWAAAAAITSALYGVMVRSKQVELGATAVQLLFYQAPVSAVMLLLAVPWMDGVGSLAAFPWTSTVVRNILLSCAPALAVNLSFMFFCGKTSALTANVTGYIKLIVNVLLGWVVGGSFSPASAFGVYITFLGLAMFSKAKTAPAVDSKKVA